jgi:hypothetical protein
LPSVRTDSSLDQAAGAMHEEHAQEKSDLEIQVAF